MVLGDRVGETRALCRGSIGWEHGKLKITESRFEGKTGKPKSRKGTRAIDLSQFQPDRLAEYCKLRPNADEDDFLFSSRQAWRKGPLCAKTLMKKVIRPLCHMGAEKGVRLVSATHGIAPRPSFFALLSQGGGCVHGRVR